MPVISVGPTIGIGADVENIIAGNPNEFIGNAPAVVTVLAVRDTGGGAGVGTIEVLFGDRQIYRSARLANSVAAGRGPIEGDDQILRDVAKPGERITLHVVETGGAAVMIVLARVDITPL